jgi:uncharacterized cupredoxin-like copper-binding protein
MDERIMQRVKNILLILSSTVQQILGEEKMKRVSPFFIVILIMFLATACGSSTPTATQAPAQPAATEVPSQSGATEAPAAGSGTQVKITLADNTIDASQTTFQVGVPYTFVITNSGRHAHNFNINPPVSVAGSLDEALNKALLAVPQEQLGVGATATAEFTFPDSAAGQLLEFSCLIRRHYEDGMHVDITVTK